MGASKATDEFFGADQSFAAVLHLADIAHGPVINTPSINHPSIIPNLYDSKKSGWKDWIKSGWIGQANETCHSFITYI